MKKLRFKMTSALLFMLFVVVLSGTASCQTEQKSQTTNEKSAANEAPETPVSEAAFFNNIGVIKAHIAAKSDLNKKDAYGSTPLHIAATFGREEAALALIEGGADINALSADGSTPLHVAAFYGRVDIVKALLNKKANTNLKNSYNVTALESVSAPFDSVKPVYDEISKSLGPLGLKLDYNELKKNREAIAAILKS